MKKCTVLANPILAAGMIATVVLCELSYVAILLLLPKDDVYGRLIMTVPAAVMLITPCCITERWCLRVTMDAKGVLYKPLFKRGKWREYKDYPRVLYAYYMHGGITMAYKVHFFVLTNRRLDNDELSHINHVMPDEDLIKIRYTERNYKKLQQALPPSMAVQIKAIREVYLSK